MSVSLGTATAYIDLNKSKFSSGIQEVKQEASELGASISNQWSGVGSKLQSTGAMMTAALTTPIVGVGTAILSVSTSFEESMSQVQATMGIAKDATSELNGEVVNTMDAMEDLAQQLGRETKFSASEAADAINFLAMAGYDTQKIYDVLPSVLDLAAAGGMGIADAADMATGVLAGFNMEGDRAGEVADKIAMLASSAKGSVSDFGEGMATVAGQARVTGQSFDDTAVALGILGDNNIAASEGGNALNRVLKNLYQPTDQAALALQNLGVAAYDANGEARALPDVLQDLQNNLDGLTQEEYNKVLSEIFDAVTLKSVPFLIDGVTEAWDMNGDSAEALIHKIRGAEDAYGGIGAAAGQAEVQLDNLGGQMTILKSGIEGLAIQFGEILLPYVKQVVEWFQGLVDKFAEAEEATKKKIVVIAALAAAIGPVLLAIGTLIKIVTSLTGVFKTIINTLKLVKVSFGLLKGLAAPFTPIIAVVGILAAAFISLWKTNEDFRDAMKAIWDQVVATFGELVGGITERIGLIIDLFSEGTGVLSGIWSAFTELLAPLFELAFQTIADLFQLAVDIILGVLDIFIGIFTGDWEMVWEAVSNIFESTWEFVTNLFENAWEAIKTIFNTMKDKIKEIVSKIWEDIKEWAQNMWNSAKEMASNFLDNVVEFFSDLPYKVGFWIGETLVKVVQWAGDMKTKASEAARGFLEAVVNFIKELPGKLWDWLVKGTQKVIEWGPKLKDKGKESLNKLKDGIVSAATSLPGAMADIGRQVVQGVWNGIQGAAGWFTSQVRGFFSGIVSGAKSALGIRSPSKVFADAVGRHIPSGIAEGFKKYLPKAIKDMDGELNEGISEIEPDDISVESDFSNIGLVLLDSLSELNNFWFDFREQARKVIELISDDLEKLGNRFNRVIGPQVILGYPGASGGGSSTYYNTNPIDTGSGGDLVIDHVTNLDGRVIARETVKYTAEELNSLIEKKRRGM